MDAITLIEKLPTDLQYLITSYDPSILFILPKFSSGKYDWFKLIKMNFSLIYDKTTCTNEEIMRVYYDNCNYETKKIIYGNFHTIIILNDGTLMGYGWNLYGQLGLGDVLDRRDMFTEIKGISKNISEIVCGFSHTIIRLTNGTLMCSGDNSYGQLGLGDWQHRKIFEEIKNIPKNIVEVTCGYYDTFIRLTNGTLMACGYNGHGHLGLGDLEHRNNFQIIKPLPKNIVEVRSGHYQTIIRLTDGTLMSSGLAKKNDANKMIFSEIPGIPKNIAAVTCGLNHTIIRLTDGTLIGSAVFFGGEGSKFEEIMGISKNVTEVICSNRTIIRFLDGRIMANEATYPGNLFSKTFKELYGPPKNITEVISASTHLIIKLTNGTLMKINSQIFSREYGFVDKLEEII
ncbi:MAG: chromosome condensation regulator [Harvfovirus sp.]|uniref:Chromosome condensation regulator n=1 Tax=Harvfovirus sp. TaxID=2487768 RepID=A0A3G5A2U7_9VIRU|nr:MAG: chromosome condensation regulator [Harvfovirus sp.]